MTIEESGDRSNANEAAVEPDDQKQSADSSPDAREKWANKTEFLLSMAGEIIGLGNVWRFPYLCYKNGGGVFFIPYFIFLFFCGIPIFFLETALGQYTSEGGVTAWRKICPMFEGVGVASQVIVIYLNIYYIVVLAWALFYLFNSFWSTLPWTSCDNYWNTGGTAHCPGELATVVCHLPEEGRASAVHWEVEGPLPSARGWRGHCHLPGGRGTAAVHQEAEEPLPSARGQRTRCHPPGGRGTAAICQGMEEPLPAARRRGSPLIHKPYADWSFLYNETDRSGGNNSMSSHNESGWSPFKVISPEQEYWFHRMLRVSNSGGLESVNSDLAMCLLLAWVICYFCIFKGVKTTGKVVYFTATFPYLMLLILFIRGVSLPGAGTGIAYYLYPDIRKLSNPDVWHDAGTQVFFSYAVCQGVLTALGSYNKYNNDCYKDCIALCVLNSSTSIFAGFVVFSILGFMSHQLGLPMEEIVSSGPGLAFIVYPRALSLLTGPQIWSFLFFLMVLLLGLDSQFVCVESLATALTDLFPEKLWKHRKLLVLAIAVVCFLLGLPFITKGGIHLFNLMDTYGPSGTNLLFIACFETVVIAWVYGASRFYDNIEGMIGYTPFPVLKYCWLFITPFVCAATLLYNLLGSKSATSDDEFVPDWSYGVAPLLTLIPMICIPIFLLISLRKGRDIITPSSDLKQIRPNNPRLTLFNHVIIKPQRFQHQEDGEEKVIKDHTSGV
ncbi:sodium- and chloride-dependent GABA transporter 2-like [Myxocyprinus asiaticus]|uniref:sodium- and chloride-dependent GABA transporter 2-like n=1 Tax=Myxocyprinus asiaticus TaxID=70543 RepID=UPI0022231644|nr:sodium- and chloride-dependent GABA transporter 2-like [Myxocyprinus asiaticus]